MSGKYESYTLRHIDNGVILSTYDSAYGDQLELSFRNLNAAFRKIKELEKEPQYTEPVPCESAEYIHRDLNDGDLNDEDFSR